MSSSSAMMNLRHLISRKKPIIYDVDTSGIEGTIDEEPPETIEDDVADEMDIAESAGRIGSLNCHVNGDKRPFPETPESILEEDERSKRARLEAEHQDDASLPPLLSDYESSDSEDVIDDRAEECNHSENSNDATSHVDSGEGATEDHQDDQPNPEAMIGVRNYVHVRGQDSRIDDLLNTIWQQMYQ